MSTEILCQWQASLFADPSLTETLCIGMLRGDDLEAWHQDVSGYQSTNTAKDIVLGVRAVRVF